MTLYQGVTLGGTGFARGKRHPTLRRRRHRSAPAPSCSARSRSADDAKVGANTVVIEDVPPQHDRRRQPGSSGPGRGPAGRGPDTDWIHLPDPIAEAMKELSARIAQLEKRLAGLSRRGHRHGGGGRSSGRQKAAQLSRRREPPGPRPRWPMATR